MTIDLLVLVVFLVDSMYKGTYNGGCTAVCMVSFLQISPFAAINEDKERCRRLVRRQHGLLLRCKNNVHPRAVQFIGWHSGSALDVYVKMDKMNRMSPVKEY